MTETASGPIDVRPNNLFKYQPLDASKKEIRVVELHPGRGQDRIRCSIQHICLGEKAEYETVSYCWGDASIRLLCILDDHPISIPFSSANVLRQARYPSTPRHLWIDALCINQEDSRERDEQVALMREIYSSSSGNLVFLDVDLDQGTRGFDLFTRLWNEARVYTNDFEDMQLIIGKPGPSKDVFSEDETRAYFALVFSPWFRRVWVMQEAALAPFSSCYIGDKLMPLLDLLRAFRWREFKYHYSPNTQIDSTSVNTALRNILTLWRYVDPIHGPYRKQDGASIADALVFARGLNSTQPRDHVFGLLGLIRYRSLPTTIMEKLRPAYSRSVLDIFRDATVAALMEVDGLPDLIFEEVIHSTGDVSSKSWPSWVPEWSSPRDLDVHPGRLNKWHFAASGNRTSEIAQLDDATIQVRGVLVDTVTSLTPICYVREWQKCHSRDQTCRWLQEVDDLTLHASSAASTTDASLRHTMNSTLLAGLNSESQPVKPQDLDAFEDARQTFTNANSSSNRPVEVFERTCNNRRYFTTSKNFLGIGPNVMKTEDVVVVVFGCRAPILLRPMETDCYSVVGECYIHGFMNDEAVGDVAHQTSQMFKLR